MTESVLDLYNDIKGITDEEQTEVYEVYELKKSKIPMAGQYPQYVYETITSNPDCDVEMIKLNYDLLRTFTPEQISDFNKACENGDDFEEYDNKHLKDFKMPELSKESVFDTGEIIQFDSYEEAEKYFLEKHENNKE